MNPRTKRLRRIRRRARPSNNLYVVYCVRNAGQPWPACSDFYRVVRGNENYVSFKRVVSSRRLSGEVVQ